MNVIGVGKRIRIYLGESYQWHHRPLYVAILDTWRAEGCAEGCAGATVVRGVADFGAHSRIHTAMLVDVTPDLPLVVEWIDSPERVARVLPKIRTMVATGMITSEDVDFIFHQSRVVSDISTELRVREMMTTDVAVVHIDTPLREAAALLIGKDYRALPVVDERRCVVGIMTNADLVERGGLRVRLELLGVLNAQQLAHELAAVETGKTVGGVMTRLVVTIGPEARLADVAHLMVTRTLKRIPVVGPDGELLGMVSRADLLRTRSDAYPHLAAERPARVGRTIGDVMRTDVPVVGQEAPLAEVLDAVVSTRLNRAVVVDESNHVVGVVTDAELLRQLSPEDHPGIVRVLKSRLPLIYLDPEERRQLEHALGKTADELMETNIPTVTADTPLGDAIEAMLKARRKILPVVDRQGRFLGAADRADLLRTLVALDGETASG
jgi:CBS domain-containing protein